MHSICSPLCRFVSTCCGWPGYRLCVVLIALLLVSCAPQERYIIGVSQCSVDIWRDKLNEELLLGTYTYDNVELRIESAGDDDSRQIEQIDRFVSSGVDLLIVAPNQVSTITPALNRAYEANIPIILFDRKTDSDCYTAFIGADNYDIGRIMGRFVATDLGGQGRVVELLGLETSSPAIDRHRGFVDELVKYPGVSLIDTESTDWTEDEGERAMERLLQRTHDFDFVFAHNDRMADGARRALRRHNIGPEVRMAGIDALPVPGGGLQKVRDGQLAASYIYPTRGDLVMKLALNILEGKPYERETFLRSAIVTADNAEVMLLQADEMLQQTARLTELHAQGSRYLLLARHQKVFLLLSVVIIVLLLTIMLITYRMWRMRRRVLEESTQAKLRFFTNVSHEFRTPLTLIADPVNRMLHNPQVNAEQKQLLELVRRNVDIMLRLVNQVLDFRKVQSDKVRFQVCQIDLTAALSEWTAAFVPVCERHGITLRLEQPSTLNVTTDTDKVESICYNLLSNAIKHTPDGGRVTVTLRPQGDDSFTLTVTDTGEGIPSDQLNHVLECFYQVSGANQKGTGIGLALVKSFVEAMGGRMSVTSQVGRGSTFTVNLPMALNVSDKDNSAASIWQSISAADLSQSLGKTGSASPAQDDKPEILVVDDNDDIRYYIAYLLRDKYRVTCAADGREGLEVAIQTVPDLIICDVMMPVMDGTRMCSQVKQTTVTSHIPLLMLTASTLEEQRLRGYDCGADAYLTKPFSAELLLVRIRNLLENRRRLRDIFSRMEVQPPRNTTGKTPQDAQSGYDTRVGSIADSPQPLPPNPDDVFVDLLRDRLNKKLSDPDLNVETLSADMGVSRVQLYRKLKAMTGLTPVELIRVTRLNRARRLVEQGGMTVSEVAYRVGFSSPSYFIKCYKERFGQTPHAKG